MKNPSFSEELMSIISCARDEALRTGWEVILPDHLMLALIRSADKEAEEAMRSGGIVPESFKKAIDEAIMKTADIPFDRLSELVPSDNLNSTVNLMVFEAAKHGAETIRPVHILLGMVGSVGSFSASYFRHHGIKGFKLAPEKREMEETSAAANALADEISSQLLLMLSMQSAGKQKS